MKRIFNILFIAGLFLTGLLAAYADSGSGQGYDPKNPPEPDLKFRVYATAAPSQGGYVYGAGLYVSGEEVHMSASDNDSFIFSCWKDGEETVSTERDYHFKMPEHSVNLVAFFDYRPQSPEEPINKHRVRIYMSPSDGGWVWPDQSFLMEEGETRDVSVSPRENYVFQGWKHNGVILPNGLDGNPQNPITITMGDRPLEYTVIFSVKSPIEPGTNSFDKKTGRMIIDDFRPGQLREYVKAFLEKMHIQDADDTFSSKVNEIVVVGPVTESDYNFIQGLRWDGIDIPNCTVIDFSRTSASDPSKNTIPNGSFHDLTALVKVVLPANLNGVDDSAFNNCPSLSEIVCYSTLPPDANSGSFGDIPRTALLRVPSESRNLYASAPGWQDFNIEALDSEAYKIILTLPAEAGDGRYRNMTLVLDNKASGRVQRLVVNDRLEYVFSNLMPESEYNLYLRNESGENMASILEIKTNKKDDPEKTIELSFSDIKNLIDLSLTVKAPGIGDVTDNVEIQWSDGNGGYVSTGSSLKRVIEGTVRYCKVVLSQGLGAEYCIPDLVKVVAEVGGNDVVVTLKQLPLKGVSGKVYDSEKGTPLKNAYISVEQLISDKYVRHLHTLTDEDGVYRAQVVSADYAKGKINCGADDYMPQAFELLDFSSVSETHDFALSRVSGTRIRPVLNWYPTSGKGPVAYQDYANLEFSLLNKTTGSSIAYFLYQNPEIVILDKVSDGDIIEVTVSGRKGDFEHSKGSVKVSNSDVTDVFIDVVEHGMIDARYKSADDKGVNAALYNEAGSLLKNLRFGESKQIDISDLKAGKYTLVAIRDNKFYHAVNSYEALGKSGLEEGRHYLKADLEVEDGKVTVCEFGDVPELPEPPFIDDVILSVNKTALTVGNYVTVRANVRFKDEYVDLISNYALRLDLPEHCSFVDKSVIKGNEPSNGDVRGRSLFIDNAKSGDLIRFCLMPEKGEEFIPTAFAEFKYNGDNYTLPIGSVRFTGEDFTIFVPKRTCRQYVYARGVTTPVSDVTLLTNGIPSGNCRSTADGNWVAKVDLIEPEQYPVQQIYGEILDSRGKTFPTLSTLVEYDPYYPELEVVKMVHNGTVVNFNHAKAKTDRKSYSYQPANDMFSLMAKFDENKERVSAVNFHIISTDGSERIIDGVYVESTQAWVAALGYPDSYRLPVNVTVDFTYTKPVPDPENPGETIGAFDDFYMGYIAPDVTPIIDPSGFVYEAVEENRLEGVKVTVFYREGRENMFGEIEWNTVKWDAAEYAQENPLFTDANGLYAWDVPQGEWQVKYEKDGYDTAYSAWLPVPPPQLEVNMGLVQNTRPVVAEVHAYKDGVDILFDKPMQTLTLTTDNIKVTVNDIVVTGSIVIPEEESGMLMSKVRFKPDEELAVTTGELQLMVSSQVRSYAGITMLEDYAQALSIEQEITEIKAEETKEITLAEPTSILVSALPKEAAAGKTLIVTNDSPDVLGLDDEKYEYEFDENGQAEIGMTGLIPGVATLSFSIKASDVVGTKTIEVKNKVVDTQQPYSTLADGTGIYDGTVIELATKTPQAVIYYTLDGSEPTVENGLIYISPLTVNCEAVVKAIAVVGDNISPVSEFNYPAMSSKIEVALEDGWNWISHNLVSPLKVEDVAGENIEQILSIDEEVIRDPKYGLLGDLVELESTKSYKIKSAGSSDPLTFEDKAVNPSVAVRMKEGWNWIGYSAVQTMTPDEALVDVVAEKGDYVIGQNGFATYDGEKWIGELQTMNPGLGYIYKSMSDKDLVYKTKVVSKAGSLYAPSHKSSSGTWVVDRRKYSSVMPVIANVVNADGSIAAEDEYTVLAFCGTECRGIGVAVEEYVMISVYGNPDDEISFQLVAAGSEDRILTAEVLRFTETPVGSLDSPYCIYMSDTSDVELVADSNPDMIELHDGVLTVNGKTESIEVFDTDGHKLLASYGGSSTLSLAGLTSGVHIVVVKADGIWSYHKIMVK